MGTFTAATAIPTGALITSAWMTNTVNDINFMAGAGGSTVAKDFAFMYRNTSQSITSSIYTAVNFDAEVFDTANGHSTSTNTHRYTAVASGKYRLTASVMLSANSGTITGIAGRFRKNSTTTTGSTGSIQGSFVFYSLGSVTKNTLVMPTTFVALNAGDWVDLVVWCDGTSPVIDPSLGDVQFGVEWVAA